MNTVKVNSTDHVSGSLSAPILLVEYADYQCPYCGQAHTIIQKLRRRFGDKLTFVFRNFPLEQLHAHAIHAAIAAEAAALQGKFWEMHDILFENQRHLDDSSLLLYAEKIGLDLSRFKEDFGNEQVIKKVEDDMESGDKAGVEGTPSFFVNGKFFNGNWTSPEFEEYLESLI